MSEYVTVGRSEEIPARSGVRLEVDGRFIAVFNLDGTFYAIDDTCTHDEASLIEGYLEGCVIECPWHGARFDLRTGAVRCLPATVPLHRYPVRVMEGELQVGREPLPGLEG